MQLHTIQHMVMELWRCHIPVQLNLTGTTAVFHKVYRDDERPGVAKTKGTDQAHV